MAMAPSGGKKPDYIERIKRQRRTSAIKFYIVAIIIGALLGLAYLQRTAIISVYNIVMNPAAPAVPAAPPSIEPEKKIAVAKPREAPRKSPDATPPIPHTPPASVAPEPAVSLKDEADARKILADGKLLLEKFEFSTASKLFQEAERLKTGSALKSEAKIWGRKAVEFENATKHVPIADYAVSTNAVLIETTDGGEWRGLKAKEDADTIFLQAVNEANPAAEGIQKFPIPKSEIKTVTAIPLSKRRGDFNEMVLGIESARTISDSTDYYDLVYLCKRMGLGEKCSMYLNRAFDGGPGHPADPHVGDSFRNVVVRRAIGRATLLMAGNRRTQVELELRKLKDTLPDYAPAGREVAAFRTDVMDKVKADFQPSLVVNDKKVDAKKARPATQAETPKAAQTAHDDEIGIVVDNSSLMGTGAAAKSVDRANAKFEAGMNIVRKYRLGVGGNKDDNNRILLQAKSLLIEAIDIYEDGIKMEPGNKAIRDRQQTANTMVYFCNKNMIL